MALPNLAVAKAKQTTANIRNHASAPSVNKGVLAFPGFNGAVVVTAEPDQQAGECRDRRAVVAICADFVVFDDCRVPAGIADARDVGSKWYYFRGHQRSRESQIPAPKEAAAVRRLAD